MNTDCRFISTNERAMTAWSVTAYTALHLLLGLSFTGCLSFDESQFVTGHAQLLGWVKDEHGEGVAGAAVFLRPADQVGVDVPWYRASSNTAGAFLVPGVPAGVYSLAVLDGSARGVLRSVLLRAGAALEVELALSSLDTDPALRHFILYLLEYPLLGFSPLQMATLRLHFSADASLFAWAVPADDLSWRVRVFDVERRAVVFDRAFDAPVEGVAVSGKRLAFSSGDQRLTVCVLEQASCRTLSTRIVGQPRWVGHALWYTQSSSADTGDRLWRWDVSAGLGSEPLELLGNLGAKQILAWDSCYLSDVVPVVLALEDSDSDGRTRLYVLRQSQVLGWFAEEHDSQGAAFEYIRTGCSPDGAYAVSLSANAAGALRVHSVNAPGNLDWMEARTVFGFTTHGAQPPSISAWGWSPDLMQFIVQVDDDAGRHTVSAAYRFLAGAVPGTGFDESAADDCAGEQPSPDCQARGAPQRESGFFVGDGTDEADWDGVPAPDPVLWRSGARGVVLLSTSAAGQRQLFYRAFGVAGKAQLTFSLEDKLDFAWDPLRERVVYLSSQADGGAALRLAPLVERSP